MLTDKAIQSLASDWPRITVVTPSYNQAQFLEATIQSVLDQGYPNLEYIIVDGGSTDGSVDIIRKYEKELAWWVSEPDSGQTDAINKGFARSSGEVLAWLNSDDRYQPGALLEAALAIKQNPSASLVYAKSMLVEEGTGREELLGYGTDNQSLVMGRNGIPQPSSFIPRRYWEQAGPLNTGYHYVMDLDYWFRLEKLGGFHFVGDSVWSLFRWYPESKTASKTADSAIEICQVLQYYWSDNQSLQNNAQLRVDSLALAYQRCAHRLYRDGRNKEARTYLRRLASLDSHNLQATDWHRQYWRTWIGTARIARVRKLLGSE